MYIVRPHSFHFSIVLFGLLLVSAPNLANWHSIANICLCCVVWRSWSSLTLVRMAISSLHNISVIFLVVSCFSNRWWRRIVLTPVVELTYTTRSMAVLPCSSLHTTRRTNTGRYLCVEPPSSRLKKLWSPLEERSWPCSWLQLSEFTAHWGVGPWKFCRWLGFCATWGGF